MKALYTLILFFISIIYCDAQIIEGYLDKLSYRAGETVTFYLYAGPGCAVGCTLNLRLEDIAGTFVYSIGNTDVPANQAITNIDPWENGYGYTPSATQWVNIPSSIPSGFYLIDDANSQNNSTRIPIIIKGDNSNGVTGADVVIICPTNTVNAYTNSDGNSGGHSLYDYNSVGGIPSTTVSFQRPQYASAHLYCNPFLDWIRTSTYKLNFISDQDMDDWNEIVNAKMLIIPGHSEYWSRQARLNFDRFVNGENGNQGKNALILSGNTMWWQVRYENPGGINPQLTCHRGSNWGAIGSAPLAGLDDDAIESTDPLLATYHWNETKLKYSILGSIGSDWLRGGYTGMTYSGLRLKLDHTQTPLLSTTNLGFHDIIPLPASPVECDGSLMKGDDIGNATLDANGDPALDLSALGFYRGEIIGYDKLDQSYHDPQPGNLHEAYCPFMVFQKTSTSGTIINTNINRWCSYTPGWTGNAQLKVITENMINLMIDDIVNNYHGNNLFANPIPPTSITVSPTYTNVSYSACSGGSVTFTPHGIYLDQAYKIDNGYTFNHHHFTGSTLAFADIYQERYNNIILATVDATCTTYHALRLASAANETHNMQSDDLSFSLFPNPTTGTFALKMSELSDTKKSILVLDMVGKTIWQSEKKFDAETTIDISQSPRGIYLVKVTEGERSMIRKVISY